LKKENNMRFVPNAVSTRVARTVLLSQKNSPSILFVGGIVGVVATTVAASRATLHLEEVIDKTASDREKMEGLWDDNKFKRPEVRDYSEKQYKQDKAVLWVRGVGDIARLYAPTVVLGAISIGMLTKSHNILTQRNAGLTAAYAAVDKAFRQYRQRVVEELGEEKDREFRHGSESRTVVVEDKNGPKKEKVKSFKDGGSMYSAIWDESNPNWSHHPEVNVMFLRTAQKYATDRLRANGHLFLNDVRRELGLEDTSLGAQVGWLWGPGQDEGDGYVDFGIFDSPDMNRLFDFVTGREGGILLDFNVDPGVIWDKI
jgi:hypothetical protein